MEEELKELGKMACDAKCLLGRLIMRADELKVKLPIDCVEEAKNEMQYLMGFLAGLGGITHK